ncbi:hypothetical protein N7451_010910 [Penicillium sp. IBT 35674x]|nr:hypothetical protein N7451_010910 [Penicillium sp. IBT 35674x]
MPHYRSSGGDITLESALEQEDDILLDLGFPEQRVDFFVSLLTDLHPSNIFVDKDWNVKSIIDLEWACSLPAETFRPPYWLTGRSIDDLAGENFEVFGEAYKEFVDVFEEEEKTVRPINDTNSYRTTIMKSSWQTGQFWYFHALDSPKGLFNLFGQHIYPVFTRSHQVVPDFSRVVSDFWAPDVEEVISTKLRDKEEYEKSLYQLFDDSSNFA